MEVFGDVKLVSLVFHCNNCDANTAFVTVRESTAATPSSGLRNGEFTAEALRTNIGSNSVISL